MAVILLKAIFFVVTTLSNLVSRLLFTGLVHFLVQMIQALKVTGGGSQKIVELIKNVIMACLDYLLEFMIKVISTIISSVFDLVKEGLFSSSTGLVGTVFQLLEKSKTSLQAAVEDVPEVLNAVVEMVGKIVTDFLSNCNDAMAYVYENVSN